MNNYEINSKTMAIIPISSTKSRIIEEENQFCVNMTPIEIIDYSCRFFGSTYKGRNMGTQNIIGSSYKNPILIEEHKNIIFFPTESSKNKNCCWISLEKIKNYKKTSTSSKIIFNTGYELIVDISINSLENQIMKSALLDFIVRKRRKIS